VLLLGVQGGGKSLVAKAVASLWNLPLLRFDVGSVFAKYIGESEANIRKAIKTAESLAPSILWLDELEKAFAGSQGSGDDTGTTQRVMGTFLTWLQEKKAPVFVIATSNDISQLPPELLRKGRFDEIFFIDLPTLNERREIFRIHLQKRGRKAEHFDLDALARAACGFSGAEIEQAIIAGLYDAFDAGRDLTTEDVLTNIQQTVPLSQTMREDIEALRCWARTRARPASAEAGEEDVNDK
jgi:SpoVK/Ycf46/Vps4 family AAA+-type ATPase